METGTLLSVKEGSRKKFTREASFERRVGGILTETGCENYHVADRFKSGLGDRYIVGGNWMEFKQVVWLGKKSIDPYRFFSPTQKNFLSAWHKAGDRTWACVLFQPERGNPHVVIQPWHRFEKHGKWSIDDIKEHGVLSKRGGLKEYVAARFGPQFYRYSNYDLS